MMNIEDKTKFWDLIGKIASDLDDRDWRIIQLIGDGESQTKTAELIGIHRNTVKKRLNRMRRLMKKIKSYENPQFWGKKK